MEKGKVAGLGGVFFKSRNPGELKEWYGQALGLPCDEYGHTFKWLTREDPSVTGHTQLGIFDKETNYFDPSEQPYMINFRVDDLDAVLERLKKLGATLVGEPESYEYGRFAWVMDPEGRKIELWEPSENPFNDD
ncbi:MAG: VOC family protein [Bacteroidales bacterium]